MRLIYFSPVPWASFSQRPHEFVEWFHNQFHADVLWVEPYPIRLPKPSDFRRLGMKALNHRAAPPWLTLIKPKALPIEPWKYLSQINQLLWRPIMTTLTRVASEENCQIGIGKPSKLAIKLLETLPNHFSFYDAMDDFPAFSSGLSRHSMAKSEQVVTAHVKKILVSSTALYNLFKDYTYKTTLVKNAYASNVLPIIKYRPLSTSIPVLGYVGTIAQWFDWPLLYALAEQNPFAIIRLIGPTYSPPPHNMPKNIELFPACDHHSAINAMRNFSVGLIPFKLSRLTNSVDPIKYYEYKALGLPILSTYFGEMIYRSTHKGIFIIDKTQDLRKIVERALAFSPTYKEVTTFAKGNSWNARFNEICKLFPN